MTTRRAFLGALAGGAALPLAAQSPSGERVYRVAVLRPTAALRVADRTTMDYLLPNALRARGYVEGRNLVIETRYADGKLERLPQLAAEIVRTRPDVIVAVTASAVRAVKAATTTVPTIIWGNFDPVALGFVSSFARPGGNMTGVLIAADGTLAVKKLELLKEAVPRGRRVAVLGPEDPTSLRVQLPELQRAAPALGVELVPVSVRGSDYAGAFAAIAAERPASLFVVATTYFLFDRKPIIELAIKHRLPSVWEWREQVEDGGLMSYGTSLAARIDRIADYVDRILKGASPAEIPIDQPTKFELSVNLQTAKAIGLAVPRPLMLRADEVIQ